jgi:hypothetical protein
VASFVRAARRDEIGEGEMYDTIVSLPRGARQAPTCWVRPEPPRYRVIYAAPVV